MLVRSVVVARTAPFFQYSLPRCLLLRPCPTQDSLYWLARKCYHLCYNAFDSQSRAGDTIRCRKKSVRYSTKEKRTPCVFLFFARIYFLVEVGRSFVRGPLHFSVQGFLRAVVCLLRAGGRFLSDAFDVAGARVIARALTSLLRESSFQFSSHTSAAAHPVRLGPLPGSIAKR